MIQRKRFSHVAYGRTTGIFIGIMAIATIVGAIAAFILESDRIDFISGAIIVIALLTVVIAISKTRRYFFTSLTFSESGIVSRFFSDYAELNLDDIKGIWIMKDLSTSSSEKQGEVYTPNSIYSKRDMLIIGSIDDFDNIETVLIGGKISGEIVLKDTFNYDYTTIMYRKNLDTYLHYYYDKVQELKQKNNN